MCRYVHRQGPLHRLATTPLAAIKHSFIVQGLSSDQEMSAFAPLPTRVERGQNLVASLPPSLLLSGADRAVGHSRGWAPCFRNLTARPPQNISTRQNDG